MITMRQLLSSNLSDRQILNKLRGLHVGVHVGYYPWDRYINGSMWTIGSKAPTLEWIKTIRKNVKSIDELVYPGRQCWLDRPLNQHRNWEKRPAMRNLVCTMFQQGAFY